LAKRKELGEDVRGIFAMPARKARLWGSLRVWRRNGEKGNEKVAEQLEVHIEVWITCLAFSVSHRRCIRTTNGLKRLIQEIKPRTRLVRIFPGKQACLRLITALVVEQS
jgi:transposase-like protein